MSKPKKPRIKSETVYRVRWSAGSVDWNTEQYARLHANHLAGAGRTVEVISFKRPVPTKPTL